MWYAKFGFDASKVYLGLFYLCKESKKEWIIKTSDLECIDYVRHPKTMGELLSVDTSNYALFDFQRSLNIEALKMETRQLERKAHVFWEIPAIHAKVTELMDSLSYSGNAKQKLIMMGDIKDAKTLFAVKKQEQDQNIKPQLSFVDSLFMMYRLRKKFIKAKAECKAYDNIRLYSHNFGDLTSTKA